MAAITLFLTLFLVVLFVGIPMLLLRAKGPTIARVVEILAVLTVIAVVVFTAVTLWQSLGFNRTTVSLQLAPRIPAVEVPGLTLDPPRATIEEAGESAATFLVTGLTWAPRLLLAAATLLQSAMIVYFAFMIGKLARNVRAGVFFKGLSSLFVGGGLLLLASYLACRVLVSVGSAIAASQALTVRAWSYTGDDPRLEELTVNGDFAALGWPQAADWSVTFETLSIGVAFALVLLGAAFAAGERMQRDTEGLV